MNPDKERLRSFPGPMVTPGRLRWPSKRAFFLRDPTPGFSFARFLPTGSERTRIGRGTRLLRACRQPPAGYTDAEMKL